MNHRVQQRLERLIAADQGALLAEAQVGLEKEGLRMAESGVIAQTSHPAALGSALTHPFITTDYAEALLEFVTPPSTDSAEALGFLHDLHVFTQQRLDNELIWAASMPCVVDGENSIRIAEYGDSNSGRFRHLYRRGLGARYGKTMQVIAGIHFNYSLPETFWPIYQQLEQDNQPLQSFIDQSYFALIRNVQRYNWLLLYLFGASPALCKSFLRQQSHGLQEFDRNTWYDPEATSLRMSDIGYSNRRRCRMQVSHDSLADYIKSLRWALHTDCPPFVALGVKVDGDYRQLNSRVLQVENEYYSAIRPKCPPLQGERPLLALQRRGVAYVELRSSDIDVFHSTGLNEPQLRFMEAFLLFCLFHDSPMISKSEQAEMNHNQLLAARQGRKPGLCLQQAGNERCLKDWGLELCFAMQGLCEQLDQAYHSDAYTQSLQVQIEALRDSDRTPSARMLAAMRAEHVGFYHFAQARSLDYAQRFRHTVLAPERERQLQSLVEQSLAEQQACETADQPAFADYLKAYLNQIE